MSWRNGRPWKTTISFASPAAFYSQAGQREEALGYFAWAKRLTKSAATREVLEKKMRG